MLLKFIISVLYVSIVDSVPFKCELPLNSSNCGLPPKMVYTYYGPKAFCHLAIWRGCPTNNKFDFENDCLITCTKHFGSNLFLGVKVTNPMPKLGAVGVASKVHELKTKPVKCHVPLNTNRCGGKFKKLVYTYNIEERACVEAIWFGCPSNNIFTDISSCRKTCHKTWDEEVERGDAYEENQVLDFPKKLSKKTDSPKKGNNEVKKKPVECDVPLNTSRCTDQMKRVFTFSNEEGACVTDIWFGCPSENKFTDVLSCQHNCPNSWDQELDRMEKYLATEKCAYPLNTKRCSRKIKSVYTYNIDKRACVKASWFGCPSINIFTDIVSCRKSCHKRWDQELERGDTYEDNKINKVLHFPKKLTTKYDSTKNGNDTAKTKGCDVPLNTKRCTKLMKQVYTYNNEKGACARALWFGCPSENLFDDISSCHRHCHVKVDKVTTIAIPKSAGKYMEYNEKAYFIYKLEEANKGAGERFDDTDIMLVAQDEYNVL